MYISNSHFTNQVRPFCVCVCVCVCVLSRPQTGLTSALEGDGPFTIFAPTDLAFAQLAQMTGTTVEELLKLPNLADILSYHVIADKVLAEDLTTGERLDTLEGDSVQITLDGGGAFVNTAQISRTDLVATNGVVHIIAAVLMPPSDDSRA